jgi:hypothetical protein
MKHGLVVFADPIARDRAIRKAAMPDNLLVPIAAISQEAIQTHIGLDCTPVSRTKLGNAFRVIAECGPEPSDLVIWKHERASVLNQPIQVWVDVAYSGYRKAYQTVYPEEDIGGCVIHHVLNRRYAALHGFRYVRLVATSRSVNSSSGFSENWGVTLTEDGTLRSRIGEASICYADISHIMPMLNMSVGGGVMENVRLAVDLLRVNK